MAQQPNAENPWKWGTFYYDPADKRLWVPKRIPLMGWTINFAHRYAWLVVLLLTALIAAAIVKAVSVSGK